MNKKLLVSILMIATIFSCIGLTGCKKTKTTNSPTKQEQVKKQDTEQKQVDKEEISKKINESKKFETKEKTACYRVSGEKNDKKVYYTMNFTESQKIVKLIKEYSKSQAEQDYNTIKGDEQFKFYSNSYKTKLGDLNKEKQENISHAKQMQYIERFIGIKRYDKIEFNKDFSKCKVTFNYSFIFKNFSKNSSYAKGGVKINKPYYREVSLDLINENNEWKILNEDFSKSSVVYPLILNQK